MKNEKGFTLIEVLVAIALLGIIGITFFGALSASSKVLFTADERTTAESLARSEMEYTRNQDYLMADWSYELPSGYPPWDETHALPTGHDGYVVNVSAVPLDVVDNGIQKITVIVKHHDADEVITLEGYKSVR